MMLQKTINRLTSITKGMALITMGFMALMIFVGVLSRTFFTPIVGDVEIVRLGMIVLIMCGLAYTQKADGHISIGIIVDKLPKKVQSALDIFGYLLTFVISVIISIIFFEVGMSHLSEMRLTTDLLSIPYYPFDFIIAIGFVLWGLEALLKVISAINSLFRNKNKNVEEGNNIWQSS